MRDNPNGQGLDFLWELFAGVHLKLDRLADDVTNLKVRVSKRISAICGSALRR